MHVGIFWLAFKGINYLNSAKFSIFADKWSLPSAHTWNKNTGCCNHTRGKRQSRRGEKKIFESQNSSLSLRLWPALKTTFSLWLNRYASDVFSFLSERVDRGFIQKRNKAAIALRRIMIFIFTCKKFNQNPKNTKKKYSLLFHIKWKLNWN